MKKRKSLSVFIVLAMVLSMFSTALAADLGDVEGEVYQEAIERMNALGVLVGDEDGNFNPDNTLIRAEAAKVAAKMVGYTEADAAAAVAALGDEKVFDDVCAEMPAHSWAIGWIKLASDENLIFGDGTGNFNPGGTLTMQEWAAILIRALGFETAEMKADWPGAYIAEADELGLTAGVLLADIDFDAEVTRAVMAQMSATTVDEVPNADGKLLAEVVFEEEVVPEVLEVIDVSADNLKEVVVVFNLPVEEESAEKVANYSLDKGRRILRATLQEDAKTVVLLLDTGRELENQEVYTLTVKDIVDADDLEGITNLDEVEFELTAFDGTLPEVVDIEFTGPKAFRIIFSEPIECVDNERIRVRSGTATYGVGEVTISPANPRVVNVPVLSSFDDEKDYTIAVRGLKDFAGYTNLVFSETITYVEPTELPTATAEVVSQTVIKVTFSRPVTGIDIADFYHTFTAWRPEAIYRDARMRTIDRIESASDYLAVVWVDFGTDHPLPGGEVEFVVRRAAVAAERIEDAWGNELETVVIALTIVDDREVPEVTDVTVRSATVVRVTFSEAVSVVDDNFELLDEDGDEVKVGIDVTTVKAGVVDVTIAASQEGKTRILSIKGVVDRSPRANRMSDFTEKVTFGDLVFTGVNRVELDTAENRLFVVFAEAMNDTALDLANYKLEGNLSFAFSGPIEFYEGPEVVKIELTDSEETAVAAATSLLIANVEDAAGNGVVGFQMVEEIVDFGEAAPQIAGAPFVNPVRATDRRTVTVQFDQALVDVERTEFEVHGPEGRILVPIRIELVNNNTGALVTLMLSADALPADLGADLALGKGSEWRIRTIFGREPKTKNVFGIAPANITTPAAIAIVEDYIAPAVEVTNNKKEIWTVDYNSNGRIDRIGIKFTEELDPAFTSAALFTVEGYTVTGLDNFVGPVVTLLLTEKTTGVDTGVTPNVTIAEGLVDNNSGRRNLFGGLDATASKDKAAPVATFVPADNTTGVAITANITITFSEPVIEHDDESTVTNAELADMLTFFKEGITPVPFTATINAAKTVITINPDSDLVTGTTYDVTLLADKLEDASDNVVAFTSTNFTTAP